MLHKLLNLTRPLIVVDTETTGVDVQKECIIEIGFQIWTAEGLTKEYRTLVNPGLPIPPASTEIHGITDEHVRSCRVCRSVASCACAEGFRPWPTFKQLAPNLSIGFKDCDYAGKNVRFDLQILAAEFARNGIQWTIGDARIVDADRLEALLNKRSLSHLYKKYTGRDLEDAHSALVDVQATTIVIEYQMQATIFDQSEGLPRDVAKLHELSFPGMIDLEGKFRFVDGIPCFTRWGKYAGKPMTVADNGYWDWILKNDFSAEAKAIAGRAKMRKYPELP